MLASHECASRAATASGFACQFVFDGINVECLVSEEVVLAWPGVKDHQEIRRLQTIANTIARMRIDHSNARPEESWQVVVGRGEVGCEQMVE